MPKTRTTTIEVYQYDELDERAKERALDWYAAGVFDYEWWDLIYWDAKQIGLKIEGFDLDRRKRATGYLTDTMEMVCMKILSDHGKDRGTYKLA